VGEGCSTVAELFGDVRALSAIVAAGKASNSRLIVSPWIVRRSISNIVSTIVQQKTTRKGGFDDNCSGIRVTTATSVQRLLSAIATRYPHLLPAEPEALGAKFPSPRTEESVDGDDQRKTKEEQA
jgi:hypothetical protein